MTLLGLCTYSLLCSFFSLPLLSYNSPSLILRSTILLSLLLSSLHLSLCHSWLLRNPAMLILVSHRLDWPYGWLFPLPARTSLVADQCTCLPDDVSVPNYFPAWLSCLHLAFLLLSPMTRHSTYHGTCFVFSSSPGHQA